MAQCHRQSDRVAVAALKSLHAALAANDVNRCGCKSIHQARSIERNSMALCTKRVDLKPEEPTRVRSEIVRSSRTVLVSTKPSMLPLYQRA